MQFLHEKQEIRVTACPRGAASFQLAATPFCSSAYNKIRTVSCYFLPDVI